MTIPPGSSFMSAMHWTLVSIGAVTENVDL